MMFEQYLHLALFFLTVGVLIAVVCRWGYIFNRDHKRKG